MAVLAADPVPSREFVALHRASMSDSPAIAALLAALPRATGSRRFWCGGCQDGGGGSDQLAEGPRRGSANREEHTMRFLNAMHINPLVHG